MEAGSKVPERRWSHPKVPGSSSESISSFSPPAGSNPSPGHCFHFTSFPWSLTDPRSSPDLLLVWGSCLGQQGQHKKHEDYDDCETNPKSNHNGICKTVSTMIRISQLLKTWTFKEYGYFGPWGERGSQQSDKVILTISQPGTDKTQGMREREESESLWVSTPGTVRGFGIIGSWFS